MWRYALIAAAAWVCVTCGKPVEEGVQEHSMNPNKRAEALFASAWEDFLAMRPELQSQLGIRTDYGLWNDRSDAFHQKTKTLAESWLSEAETLDVDALSEKNRFNLEMFNRWAKNLIKGFDWRYYDYPVNQMDGVHANIPAFLINTHQVVDRADAEAYIARLQGVKKLLGQVVDGLKTREEMGIVPPKFVFSLVVSDCENLLSGKPFDDSQEDSTLLADFKTKLANLNLSDQDAAGLLARAEAALKSNLEPAYRNLITFLKEQEQRAVTDDGAWKFPNGGAYYQAALEQTTSTAMTAEEIHQLGLDEVARIHGEMRALMEQVSFEGSLQEFFEFMRTDPRFYYSNDEAGRERYLSEATALIDTMRGRLDEVFITKPKAEIVVRRVEPFREKSAGKAFYEEPAPDGSRPGVYYANLYNMADMPTYQMEALAYHEGIPGHHMQLAIANELEGIPMFRKYVHYTAYIEGWALYTELMPKEMGFYQDPYSDFGRLAMELWRACRLVVDTGIHDKKWSREEAIQYLIENTPNPEGDCTKAIERYIVIPSQATAYKIGMNKILDLREQAKSRLGESFDIRAFHDVILTKGPMPLDLLEKQVDAWIERQK